MEIPWDCMVVGAGAAGLSAALVLGRARQRTLVVDAGGQSNREWERHDLAVSFPSGRFDLVSACYLHSPVEMPRERIPRSAAAAVAPGGTLLVVGHAGFPSRSEPHPEIHFPTPQEVLDDLALTAGRWEVKRSDFVTRQLPAPDGEPGTRPDNVLSVGRLAG